ncbi:Crp/Fnr family transcriptional regulator [Bradyrhizobium sp. AUGA SZCCT0222]|uniref:Crp/Fnr family transcriptional regulator n=1 Tax=Bradyrhizobium sp. AUGA SZCCT0222 TaxID=2807668 RepID=UPI001BAB0727|nr:Crp/Fnr family transcriptional regulator [Bradyrhizobium sp. AUGA SZCCT0222]MBR1270266.1 Crp/Fnr family transcriptional regulator [Bradyrhizobium sp. AUGA SZCCT0222]
MTAHLAAALITKLTVSNFLDEEDIEALRRLPIHQREFKSREAIVSDGQRPHECCLIGDGFAFRSKTTVEGQRQVLSLHIPGEVPDLQSLHLKVMDHDLTTLTPCTLGFIPHTAVNALNKERPNVAAALWRETLIDAAIFREWLLSLGRRSADARMAHLLLELHRRLDAVGRAREWEFELPVTQADLGDCLGLSTVHINRVLQHLRKEGLIEVQRTNFRLLDPQKLEALAQFDPTYLHLHPEI